MTAQALCELSSYFHRNLNPPKLVDVGFTPVARGDTIARMVKKFALPANPLIPGFREMTRADVPQVGALLRKYMARFDMVQTFEKDEEVEHWFLSGRGTGDRQPGGGKGRDGQVVWAYVVEVNRNRPIVAVECFE
jgi:glycylpeptide N-tetradecanoyltransferase